MADRMTLERGRWYAWQMLPGYVNGAYYSPIRVNEVEPLKSGQSRMKLDYLNAAYAQGVQSFKDTLRVLLRAEDYMIVVREEGQEPAKVRSAIITPITWDWLRLHFGGFVQNNRPRPDELSSEGLREYLQRVLT
tara:strand:- start:12957 stop:13358 length:402 start_codon:yes stop_codon:yes gene_type:complete